MRIVKTHPEWFWRGEDYSGQRGVDWKAVLVTRKLQYNHIVAPTSYLIFTSDVFRFRSSWRPEPHKTQKRSWTFFRIDPIQFQKLLWKVERFGMELIECLIKHDRILMTVTCDSISNWPLQPRGHHLILSWKIKRFRKIARLYDAGWLMELMPNFWWAYPNRLESISTKEERVICITILNNNGKEYKSKEDWSIWLLGIFFAARDHRNHNILTT